MEAKISANGDSEQEWWYTFTVEKAGYYEFIKTETTSDGTKKHDITVQQYGKAFGSGPEGNKSFGNTSNVYHIEKPCELIYKIIADREKDAEGKNTTGETNVTLSIKEFKANPLNAGSNKVDGLKKQGDVVYYSFEKGANESYTIEWKPKEAEAGKDVRATVKYGSTPTTEYGESAGSVTIDSKYLDNDTICYIKVTQDGADSVEGELIVTAKAQTSSKNALTSGDPKDFSFEKGQLESIQYTFITPADSELGYTVIVENTTTVDETKQTMPKFDVNINGELSINSLGTGKASREMTKWAERYQPKTITISLTSGTAASVDEGVVKATGRITVQPVKPSAFTADRKATSAVKQGTSDWFGPYEITEAARYSFSKTVPEEQKANDIYVATIWYKKSYVKDTTGKTTVNWKKITNPSAEYIEYIKEGDEIYVNIKAKDGIPADGLNVTASFEKLQTGTLAIGEDGVTGKATLTKDSPKYYIFKAPEYASYTIGDASDDIRKYIPENELDEWSNGASLKKDEEILILVTPPADGNKELTVTKTAITKLTLNTESQTVTVKYSKPATFEFTPYTEGYYDFVTSVPDKLSISVAGGFNGGIGSGYAMIKADEDHIGKPYTITVSNADPEQKDVPFTIKAQNVDPITVELDKGIPVTVNKGRLNVLEFAAPEDYFYTVDCGTDVKAVNSANMMDIGTEVFWTESLVTGTDKKPTPKTFYLKYTGEASSATPSVKVSKLVPDPVSGEKIALSLKAGESKWYAYKPAKAGQYIFATSKGGVDLEIYRSLKNDSESYGTMGLGADSEVYIKVTNDSGADLKADTDSITVTLSAEAKELTGNEFVSPNQGITYLTYKAPEDGLYTFTAENGSLTYYGKSAWQTQIDSTSSQFIKGGDVVYLSIEDNNGPNPAEGSEEEVTRAKVSVEKTGDAQFLGSVDVKAGKYQWITFKAPMSGEYTFASTNKSQGDPKAWFCKDKSVGDNASESSLSEVSEEGYGTADDELSNNNFAKRITLKTEETVHIAAGNFNLNNDATYDVYVAY